MHNHIPEISQDYVAQISRELANNNKPKKPRKIKKYYVLIDGQVFMTEPNKPLLNTNKRTLRRSLYRHLWEYLYKTIFKTHPYYNSDNNDEDEDYWEDYYEAHDLLEEKIEEMIEQGRIRIEEMEEI